MSSPHTLIIGAGAADLSAACFCSRPALMLERLASPGRKLLATGDGSCNLTHECSPREMIHSFGRNSSFAAPAIYHFSPSQIRAFFARRGVPTIVQPDGWDKATLTRGGLAVQELDPRTLACRSISNLYCAGEVVDVDGPCGGYNLAWAFASGSLAAASTCAAHRAALVNDDE
ncbi:MAG: NAD(P)/FAD-dependent oxidoreductase [Kiritimatiellia bacterium]